MKRHYSIMTGNKEKRRAVIIYIISAFISFLFFVLTYGIRYINPGDVSLSYIWGDGMQHYYGFKAFRRSPWEFPIGLFNGVTYPDKTSIIFTDSIPWLSVLFKLFDKVLPADFQYFGLWALLSYILLSVITVRILRNFTDDPFILILSSSLMSFIDTVIVREFSHEALGGQWLILLSWELFIDIYLNKDKKRMVLRSALIAALSAGIHIYFLPICGFIILSSAALYLIRYKDKRSALFLLLSYFLSAVFFVYLLGGFSSKNSVINKEFDHGNNMNLNSLFNPLSHSYFFKELPLYFKGQDDGNAYLGLGFFIIIFIDILVFLFFIKKKGVLKRYRDIIISFIAFFIPFFYFSTYPFLTFNDKYLFKTKAGGIIDGVMSVFRCPGRGAWALSFFIMIFSLILLIKEGDKINKKRLIIPILLISLIFQIADLSPLILDKQTDLKEDTKKVLFFTKSDEIQSGIKNETFKHVVLYKDCDSIASLFLSAWAIDNDLTVNRFYLARPDDNAYEKRLDEAIIKREKDDLFIFDSSDDDLIKELGLKKIYKTKTFIVCVAK